MTKPQARMLISRPMQDRCFSGEDINRIAAATDLTPALAEEMDEDAQLDAIAGAELIVTGWGTQPITPAMLDAAPGLRFMFHSAGSVKHLVSPGLVDRGVRVCSARSALAKGVAEYAFGTMLVAMKAGWRFHADTLTGLWDRDKWLEQVCEPYGATVGIIGASWVGREMIRWCSQLDLAHLLVYDPYVSSEEMQALGATKADDLDDLVSRADVVSLHTPATGECHHIIDGRRLGLMRDNAIFINTSRGRCVDEEALISELETGRLFAIIDVTYPEEPPAEGSKLYSLPNCVLTPHIAGSIKQNCKRQGALVADQVQAVVNGEQPFDELDLSQLTRYA